VVCSERCPSSCWIAFSDVPLWTWASAHPCRKPYACTRFSTWRFPPVARAAPPPFTLSKTPQDSVGRRGAGGGRACRPHPSIWTRYSCRWRRCREALPGENAVPLQTVRAHQGYGSPGRWSTNCISASALDGGRDSLNHAHEQTTSNPTARARYSTSAGE
jgi:hypothetical protein